MNAITSSVAPLAAALPVLPADTAGPLLAQLVRASLEGALFAGAVWLLCRLVPRIPPAARSLLWWAACLKLVVGLFWVAPLPLAVLPPGLDPDRDIAAPLRRWATWTTAGLSGARDPGARPLDGPTAGVTAVSAGLTRPAGRAPDASANPHGSAAGSGPGPSSSEGRPVNALGPLPNHGAAMGDTDPSAPSPGPRSGSPLPSRSWVGELFGRAARAASHFRLGLLLAALWAVGALAGLGALAAQLGRTRRVRRSSAPVAEPLVAALFSGLCRDMGLSRRPELLASEEVGTPQALGLRHPAVVLPRADLARLSSQELEMALCHELVHLCRRDLWLGWVPALAERLFFFHPLAALAAREYALARESACDAEVLRVLGAAPRDYGRLLVRLGVTRRTRRPVPAFALGAAPAIATLKRRLEMLQHSSETPRRRPVWLWLAGLALVAALPSFRLVALTRPAAEPAAIAGAAGTARPASQSTAISGPAAAASNAIAAPAAASNTMAPAAASASVVIVDSAEAAATARAALTTAASALATLVDVAPLEASPASRAGAAAPPAPTPPPPPAPPNPPAQAAMAGDAEESSYWTWSSDDDGSDAYVLRLGESNFMHGSSDDMDRVKALGGGDVLWFRRGGKEYAIRDAGILAAAKELVRPSIELGKRQGELGSRQAELGSQQAKLGSKQAELGSRQAALGARQAALAMQQAQRDRKDDDDEADDLDRQQRELGRQQAELGRQQGELGEQQGALGEKQGALGKQQGELGRQQAEASRKAEAGLARLVDDAIKRGLAQEVGR